MVNNSPDKSENTGDIGLISGSGSSLGEGNGNPLHYSCLENPMNRGVRWATVLVAAKRHEHDELMSLSH